MYARQSNLGGRRLTIGLFYSNAVCLSYSNHLHKEQPALAWRYSAWTRSHKTLLSSSLAPNLGKFLESSIQVWNNHDQRGRAIGGTSME